MIEYKTLRRKELFKNIENKLRIFQKKKKKKKTKDGVDEGVKAESGKTQKNPK